MFKRELANKMYTPTTYFLARYSSHMVLQVFYPLILLVVLFWGLSIDTSFHNFAMFFLDVVGLNFVMCSQGYFCGVLTDNENGAQQINTFAILLFMLTSGGLGNLATFPTFIEWISYISPQRYALQGYFYRLTRQVPEPFRTMMTD